MINASQTLKWFSYHVSTLELNYDDRNDINNLISEVRVYEPYNKKDLEVLRAALEYNIYYISSVKNGANIRQKAETLTPLACDLHRVNKRLSRYKKKGSKVDIVMRKIRNIIPSQL